MVFVILIAVCVAAAFVFFYHGPHSRFRRNGVKYLLPVPLLGDMGRVIFRMQHVLDNMDRLYKAFPGERFIGTSELIRPVIVIRDPELVKRITIQDFDHFHDHGVIVDRKVDSVFGGNLFALKGQHWKDMRSKVSPMFTSSKLRVMVPYMVDAGENVINMIKRNIVESGENSVDLDIKDVANRYANDVLASSIYGLKLDSHNQDNDFFEMAKLMSQLKYSQLLKFMSYQVAPGIMKIMNLTMFSKRASQFFAELLKKTLKGRKEQNIHRPDLIEIFLQYQEEAYRKKNENTLPTEVNTNGEQKTDIKEKPTETGWSQTDLLSQIVGFLVAGFDVTASSIAFLAHMLAVHPDVQEKLVREIREYEEMNEGKMDYDSILRMPYLDMVVSEGLRMWAASISERNCVKDYNLGRPNDKATKDYIIRKGETVRMFLRSIHLDPEYHPDPLRFNPERFSKENRQKIRPGTYTPFGAGPRVCIGSRFAVIEIKVMIIRLLQNMEVSPCVKTQTVLQLSTSSLIPLAVGGHWVKLQPRSKKQHND